MESRQLKANQDKAECLMVGKSKNISRVNMSTLCIDANNLDVSNTVKDLGVLLDCNLSMKGQIQKVVKIARYHLKNIGFVRKYLDEATTKMLVHNHVISKLYYCNSLYYGLPKYLLKELQLVLNRTARLIKGLSPREKITLLLINLH